MKWNEISYEDISSPSGHHVAVEESSQGAPHDRSVLDCFYPEKEGENEQKDGDCFVIIAAGN